MILDRDSKMAEDLGIPIGTIEGSYDEIRDLFYKHLWPEIASL